MSKVSDMISDAVADLSGGDSHGERFTVDGVRGVFMGVFSDLSTGNALSEQGMEPFGSGTLMCGKFTTWTPFEGQLVAIRGMQYRIASITNDPTHWRISLSIPSA